MDITEEQTIWFQGIYNGRQGDYTQLANITPKDELVKLVQKRAEEDGEWAIKNKLPDVDEETMRKMMAWVSDPENIMGWFNANPNETVDWICHDLGNTALWRFDDSRG